MNTTLCNVYHVVSRQQKNDRKPFSCEKCTKQVGIQGDFNWCKNCSKKLCKDCVDEQKEKIQIECQGRNHNKLESVTNREDEVCNEEGCYEKILQGQRLYICECGQRKTCQKCYDQTQKVASLACKMTEEQQKQEHSNFQPQCDEYSNDQSSYDEQQNEQVDKSHTQCSEGQQCVQPMVSYCNHMYGSLQMFAFKETYCETCQDSISKGEQIFVCWCQHQLCYRCLAQNLLKQNESQTFC